MRTGGSGPMMIAKSLFAALLSVFATPTNALTRRNERQYARKIIVVGPSLRRIARTTAPARLNNFTECRHAKSDMRIRDKRLIAKY